MSSAAPTAVVDLKAATRHLMVDFLQMKEFTAEPLILTEGEGVWVTDVDGNRYLDSISGVYTVSVGHRNQAAIDAVTAQLHRIAFASPVMTTNPAAIELATLLTRVSPPGMTTVKFFSGGSEACEAAIKLARQYHSQTGNPHKVKILGRYGDYHGATLGALGSSGSAGASRSFGPFAPGFVHVHQPMAMRCPYCRHRGACDLTCAEIIEATIEAEGADTVAAFIATPVSFAVWPPADYWPTVRRICDRHNVLLIYDEIITGFGRLGTLWGADYVGAAPDIIACGKGMGGGYGPLAATIIRDRVAAAFWGEEGTQFFHGHTFGGNPLSCAAGLAVLRQILDERLPERAARVGAYLRERLEGLRAKYDIIAEVRGAGLLASLLLAADRATGARIANEAAFARALHLEARKHRLLLRPYNGMVVFAPPLIIGEAEIDHLVAAADAAFAGALARVPVC